MTRDNRMNDPMLGRLADAMVDDLLATSDGDLLAEEAAAVGDVAASVEPVRLSIRRAMLESRKSNLARAKQGVRAARQSRPTHEGARVRSLDDMRALIESAVSGSDALTLAAREGKGLPDADVPGLFRHLVELGAITDGQDEE